MSARNLSHREKRLLAACVGILLLMGTMLLTNHFIQKRIALLTRAAALEQQLQENKNWLADRDYWHTKGEWVEKSMPVSDSLGRAQGQLLEEMQDIANDLSIKVERQTLLEPATKSSFREVSVNLRLYGDQTTLLQWLSTMQSPESFQIIKQIEFEIDTRAKTAKPQARCNLTVARWFKPEDHS